MSKASIIILILLALIPHEAKSRFEMLREVFTEVFNDESIVLNNSLLEMKNCLDAAVLRAGVLNSTN